MHTRTKYRLLVANPAHTHTHTSVPLTFHIIQLHRGPCRHLAASRRLPGARGPTKRKQSLPVCVPTTNRRKQNANRLETYTLSLPNTVKSFATFAAQRMTSNVRLQYWLPLGRQAMSPASCGIAGSSALANTNTITTGQGDTLTYCCFLCWSHGCCLYCDMYKRRGGKGSERMDIEEESR